MKAEKKRVAERKGADAGNYFLQSIHNYADSFRKIRIDIFLMALYDAIFFYLIFSIAKGLLLRIFDGARMMLSMRVTEDMEIEALKQGAALIKSFFFSSAIEIISAILLSIFLYCVFKSLVWALAARRRLAWNYLSGFCAMSFIWFIGWIVICILSYFLLTEGAQKAVYAIVLLLLLYLTPVMNAAFAKSAKIFHSIKSAFTIGIGNIHLFMIPYILSIATGIAILFLISQIFKIVPLPQEIAVIVPAAYVLLHLAWHRIYLNIIAGEIR